MAIASAHQIDLCSFTESAFYELMWFYLLWFDMIWLSGFDLVWFTHQKAFSHLYIMCIAVMVYIEDMLYLQDMEYALFLIGLAWHHFIVIDVF